MTAGRAGNRLDTSQSGTRLQRLFLVALLGVLAAVGVAVAELAGRWVSLGYAVLAVVLLYIGAARARAARERARVRTPVSGGRTCTCCTTTQHDSVKVL